MSDENAPSRALCGDPTCQDFACTQAALDAHYRREWDAAGEIVYGAMGLTYTLGSTGEQS